MHLAINSMDNIKAFMFVYIFFRIITAVASAENITYTPLPAYSTVKLPFKQSNIQTCVVNGTVVLLFNSPGDTIMGLEIKQGAIREVFRDQTLNQTDVVFGCKKTTNGAYNYVYMSDENLYIVTDGLKEGTSGLFTNLIKSKSRMDNTWAIAKGSLGIYNWIYISETIDSVVQTALAPGEYFGVRSNFNHASVVSLSALNRTHMTAQYYTYNIDTNDIVSSSMDIFLPLNPEPNLKVFELQQDYWICASEFPILVTRLTKMAGNMLTPVYDSYEDAPFLDVAFLGTNFDIAVVAVGSSVALVDYSIIVYIYDLTSLNLGFKTQFIETVPFQLMPDPATISEFFSLVRLDHTKALLSYVVDGTLYGRIISLDGDVSGWNDLVVADSTTLTVVSTISISTLILEQNSILKMQEGAIIQVSGCASFDGTLVLVLANETIQILRNSAVTIDIVQYLCWNGRFSRIDLEGEPDLDECEKMIGKPSYSPSLLAITVSIDNSQCNLQGKGPSSGVVGSDPDSTVIAGVVAAGGCVLVVGILLLAFYFSPLRQKVFPYARPRTK